MSKFGWSYPPGAANDPNAPYNQDYPDITVLRDKRVIARKDHTCEFCGQLIAKGSGYRYIVVKDYDHDKISTSKQHIFCPYERGVQ